MLYQKKINNSLVYIFSKIREKISVEECAEAAGMSLFYYQKMFPKVCGVSFREFINRTKIINSARELVFEDKKVYDTAYDWGYNSHETYTRAFKKVFGFSPKEVKKNKKLKGEIMKANFENMFVVPGTEIPLKYEGSYKNGELDNGKLISGDKKTEFPVINGIPKFSDEDLVVNHFGSIENYKNLPEIKDQLEKRSVSSLEEAFEISIKDALETDIYNKLDDRVISTIKKIASYKGSVLGFSTMMGKSYFPLYYRFNKDFNMTLCCNSVSLLNILKEIKVEKNIMNNINFCSPDTTNLPFKAESCDAIVTESILSYVSDNSAEEREKFLKNCHRIIKVKGRLFMFESKYVIENQEDLTEEIKEKIQEECKKRYNGHEINFSDMIIPYEESLKKCKFRVVQSTLIGSNRVKAYLDSDATIILEEFGFRLKSNNYIIEAEKM